ncbi:MAG: HAMP domain-containing histidine kinase [Proteobacteria bacterium]|nr:HAMP domain-containing histidine kinase [Pseudomonadota bacterium]
MRLRSRLILVIGVVTLLPLVVTGYMTSRLARDHNVEQSRQLYARQASGLAVFAGTWIGDLERTARLAVAVWDVETLDTERREALQRVLYQQFDAVNVVVTVDGEGTELTRPTFLTELPPDLEQHLAVDEERASLLRAELPLTEALASGAALGRIYRPDPEGALVVPMAVGSREGAVVVGLEVSLAVIEEHLASQAVPGGAAVLVDRSAGLLIGDGLELVDASLADAFVGDLEGDLRYASAGEPVLAAFSSVAGTEWAAVVAVPEAQATRAGDAIRDRSYFVYLLAIVLVAATGGVAARQIAQPVVKLREAAQRLGQGEYPDVDLGGQEPAEIGDLARVFNETSGRLAEQADTIAAKNAEIEAWNAELQERVEERTRLLEESQGRLVQSSRLAAVAQMGAGLAHELNNPLAGILGMAQLAKARAPDDMMLASIEEQALRCRDVVQALQRLTAQGGGTRVRLNLTGTVSEVVALVGHGFDQADVNLEHRMADGLFVDGDPALLGQALAQLLTSLRTRLAPGATLRVVGSRVDDEVQLVFTLEGPSRGDSDDWLASGMGYWIASHAVEEHGGRIEEADDRYVLGLPAG